METDSSSLLLTEDEDRIGSIVQSRSRSSSVLRPAAASGLLLALAAVACLTFTPRGVSRTTANVNDGVRLVESKCSWIKTNCTDSQCCREAGMQCYEQSSSWAQCMADCKKGPHPTHWDGADWTCNPLGVRTEGTIPSCAGLNEDCSDSRCCSEPGTQCYEKQKGWATCKVSCTTGVDLSDANSDPWTCDPLGDRAEMAADWVAGQCTASGKDCRKTKCCAAEGEQCYARDSFWAQCMPSCKAGPNPDEPWNPKAWSCDEVGLRTPEQPVDESKAYGLADWVSSYCSKEGENCKDSQCCSEFGLQCYEKNETFSKCRSGCDQGPDLFDENSLPWTCHAQGPRTPGDVKLDLGREVAPWVADECAKSGEGCLESGCCAEVGQQCYAKSDGWATCLGDCEAGKNRTAFGDIDSKPWSCNKLGPRTPRPWGTPSLYCVSVLRTIGYEPDMMRAQLAKGAGIFACDDYDVFSNEPYQGRGTTWWHPEDEVEVEQPLVPMDLGVGPLGRLITIPFKPTYVGESLDNTAGNTELFLRVWHLVRDKAHYGHLDWVLKVDPDAVLVPDRMRKLLEPYTGQKTYIVNCDKPGMAPMMFGSVEMLSTPAMEEYFAREKECTEGLDWKVWGEDYFLGKCFDMLGVTRTNQFSAVQDGVCKGVDCSAADAGAFHPMKDTSTWLNCWDQAHWNNA